MQSVNGGRKSTVNTILKRFYAVTSIFNLVKILYMCAILMIHRSGIDNISCMNNFNNVHRVRVKISNSQILEWLTFRI